MMDGSQRSRFSDRFDIAAIVPPFLPVASLPVAELLSPAGEILLSCER